MDRGKRSECADGDEGLSSLATEGAGRTWKKPGGIGPPGMASFGGMLPITGLGAAAALWNTSTHTILYMTLNAGTSRVL